MAGAVVTSFNAESERLAVTVTQGMGRGQMGSGSDVDHASVADELRAVVECLLTARYSEVEIVDYLEGPFGLAPETAQRAVRAAVGSNARRGIRGTR